MTEFVRAIKRGDLKKIKYLIEEYRVDTRFTLSWAGEYGHFEVVKYLVSLNPPPIDYRWDRGDDCIVHAAIHGHLEIVKYLVSLGANIFQDYIFTKCAENGQIHILKYIISLGGNIILPDTIFWAASNGQVDTLKYLVSQGADVRIEDDLGSITRSSKCYFVSCRRDGSESQDTR
jgi:ankyrin repeat protein